MKRPSSAPQAPMILNKGRYHEFCDMKQLRTQGDLTLALASWVVAISHLLLDDKTQEL